MTSRQLRRRLAVSAAPAEWSTAKVAARPVARRRSAAKRAARQPTERAMMRRAGRVLDVLDEGRSAGGAISPELPSRRDQSRRRRGLGATPNHE